MHLRESASRAFTLLARNPRLFGRTALAKAGALRGHPSGGLTQRRFGGVLFEADLSENPSARSMRFGACSPLIIDAMNRYLRPGGVFIDVGANVGYLSAIGADLVGPGGQVHCFEPVPRYFQAVRRLADLNDSYSIVANSSAAGAIEGSAKIHVTREPGQSTLVDGYKSGSEVMATIDVPVVRLDSYIASHRIAHFSLMKIDTEGFELPVLEGLRNFFDTGGRPPIVCEIAPRAYPLIGRTMNELKDLMSQYGYAARDIADGHTPIDLLALKHVTDVLFLPER